MEIFHGNLWQLAGNPPKYLRGEVILPRKAIGASAMYGRMAFDVSGLRPSSSNMASEPCEKPT